jgi:uncharacterized membrane protein
VIELFNLYRRIGAEPGVIVPTGLALPVMATLLPLFTGGPGGRPVYRHRVGMADAWRRADDASLKSL